MSEQSGICPGTCGEFFWNPEAPQPDDCPGPLAEYYFPSEYVPEGMVVQVCPRASTLGQEPRSVGGGNMVSDIVILHRDTLPTEEEIQRAVDDHLDES